MALTAAALACLLAAAPLLPERHSPRPAVVPTDRPATLTAGAGRVDTRMQAEIDRVVNEGRRQPRMAPGQAPGRMVSSQVRCAEFEGQRYCLGQGWTDRSQLEVQQRVSQRAAAALSRSTARGGQVGGKVGGKVVETTGDLSAIDELRQRAAMSPAQRAKAERQELTDAARSVAKVLLLRHEIEGTPLPPGFARRHPEAGLRGTNARAGALQLSAGKTFADYPERRWLVHPSRAREQERTYWCGPATMQMIGAGWRGGFRSQSVWAGRLGTTRSGSSITALVSVTNRFTGWDSPDRAGRYVTLDIGNYTYGQWWMLMMRHYNDYRAPVILHPLLHKQWYPYLDDDASGHFQMGRGYDKRGSLPNQVSYFEPWNQQRFDPSEPYIKRVQWHNAYSQFRANKAHFQHNVGV